MKIDLKTRLWKSVLGRSITHDYAITWEIDVECVYNAFENEKIMALLDFHAFTGCDLTERFSGFSKTIYFDTYLKSDLFVYK